MACETGYDDLSFRARSGDDGNETLVTVNPERRYRFYYYNLDRDITGLRLTSLDREAKKNPWLAIRNGVGANVDAFFVDLKRQPGWAQSRLHPAVGSES